MESFVKKSIPVLEAVPEGHKTLYSTHNGCSKVSEYSPLKISFWNLTLFLFGGTKETSGNNTKNNKYSQVFFQLFFLGLANIVSFAYSATQS